MKWFFATFAATVMASSAQAEAPISVYGHMPVVRSMALSPDAERIAYFFHDGEVEAAVIQELADNVVSGLGTNKVKARSLFFASNEHLVLRASKTARAIGVGKFEYSAAYSYNTSTEKLKQLLRSIDNIFPNQSGLGRIVGASEDRKKVYMPAYMGSAYDQTPTYSLLSVDLDSGRGRVIERGSYSGRDWIVDEDGTVLAFEEHIENRNIFRISTKISGKWEVVYEASADVPPFALVGVTPERDALVIISESVNSGFSRVSRLAFDGKASGPVFVRPDREVETVLMDESRVVIGVKYSGMTPDYDFFDPGLKQAMDSLLVTFAEKSVDLVDWTSDYSKLLIYVAGGGQPPRYFLYDRADNILSSLPSTHKDLDNQDVGEVYSIKYTARDGLTIPAVLTLPNGMAPGEQSLPLIVIPHGGPEMYDAVGFDWMAQYFASRGYMVLQPNFRGSTGFGVAHRQAGYGEWGAKMQDDVTDGVGVLVRNGWADGDRVCIIGASYGGYAALAGGAFTPNLYQCVAAIAPVADVPGMLGYVRHRRGRDSWANNYWAELIGDRREDRDKLEAISPTNHAEVFQAPVLLLHGVDDTVVPFTQSRKMERALKRAGKNVTLVTLKREDHWLSSNETRLETLTELSRFVEAAIGSDADNAQ